MFGGTICANVTVRDGVPPSPVPPRLRAGRKQISEVGKYSRMMSTVWHHASLKACTFAVPAMMLHAYHVPLISWPRSKMIVSSARP